MIVENERNRYFDYIKGIACISVVFIHCQFPGSLGMILGGLTKFAVPFFFMISGYYAICNGKFNCKKKIMNIIRQIVWAEVLFFLYEALKALFMDKGIIGYLSEIFNIDNFIWSILMNKPITSSHLWFLYALIYCYITLFIINKFDGQKFIPLFILIGHVGFIVLGEGLEILGHSYRFVFEIGSYDLEIVFFNMYIFRALPYFLMGYMFSSTLKEWKITRRYFYIILVLGSLLSIIERYLIGWFQFYLGTFFVVTALFIYAKEKNGQWKAKSKTGSWVENIGKRDSDFVYVIHILIASMMSTFMKLTGLAMVENNFMMIYNYIRPIIILGICLILAEFRSRFILGCKKRKLNEQ